jgi:hypothetical protein
MSHPRSTALFALVLLSASPVHAQQDAAPEAAALDATSLDATAPDAAVQDAATPDAEPPDAHDEPAAPILGTEVALAVPDGVVLHLSPPDRWAGTESKDVDIQDLSQIPGAQALFKHTWTSTHHRRATLSRLTVVCATAPSDDWAPGMESLVFERLNTIASAELAEWMTVSSLVPGPIDNAPPLYLQSFKAEGRAGGQRREGSLRVLEVDHIDDGRAPVVGTGRHFIGFLANPDRVLVCSAACVEPAWRSVGVCPASIASIHLDGALVPEPSPSTAGRLLLGVQRRPSALLGTAAGLVFALVGVLIILRGLLLRPSPPG